MSKALHMIAPREELFMNGEPVEIPVAGVMPFAVHKGNAVSRWKLQKTGYKKFL